MREKASQSRKDILTLRKNGTAESEGGTLDEGMEGLDLEKGGRGARKEKPNIVPSKMVRVNNWQNLKKIQTKKGKKQAPSSGKKGEKRVRVATVGTEEKELRNKENPGEETVLQEERGPHDASDMLNQKKKEIHRGLTLSADRTKRKPKINTKKRTLKKTTHDGKGGGRGSGVASSSTASSSKKKSVSERRTSRPSGLKKKEGYFTWRRGKTKKRGGGGGGGKLVIHIERKKRGNCRGKSISASTQSKTG